MHDIAQKQIFLKTTRAGSGSGSGSGGEISGSGKKVRIRIRNAVYVYLAHISGVTVPSKLHSLPM
jgi:hypothetical protein